MKKGMVFDIQRFTTGDGPGIRTLIFMKGCPLSCLWCANPESQLFNKEIMYHWKMCKGCNKCILQCPNDAIENDKIFNIKINPYKCILCEKCVDSCYFSALETIGKEYSADEIIEIVNRDRMFYDESGGGITISGGEPFMQADFVYNLIKQCKLSGLSTAIETCGYVEFKNIYKSIEFLDLIFYDIKHINDDKHKEYTGKSNKIILDNLRKLTQFHKNIIVRIPYIPGVNSDLLNIRESFKFIASLKNIKRIEIMPYHRLGLTKYSGLGRDYKLKNLEPVKKLDIKHLEETGREYGLNVNIGSI